MSVRLPFLPIIEMTPQEKEDYRKAEAAYMADRFANPRDNSRANEDAGDNQMSAEQSIAMFMGTSITSMDVLHEMYKNTRFFGIDNDMKV